MLLIRLAVAIVWIYQGFWCKLLGRAPRHRAIVEGVPFVTPAMAHRLLFAIGGIECVAGVWALSGWAGGAAAVSQTVLLVTMNGAGIVWAGTEITDRGAMLVQNFAFLVLAWVAAGALHV